MSEAPTRKPPWWLYWLGLAARLVVAALLIFAAVVKLGDLPAFAKEVNAYQLVPFQAINIVAVVMPWFELITAAVLIIGPWRKEAWLLIVLALVGFIVFKGSAYARGMSIECGCFGHGNWLSKLLGEALKGIWGVLFNLGLIALLLLDAFGTRRSRPRAAANPPQSAALPATVAPRA